MPRLDAKTWRQDLMQRLDAKIWDQDIVPRLNAKTWHQDLTLWVPRLGLGGSPQTAWVPWRGPQTGGPQTEGPQTEGPQTGAFQTGNLLMVTLCLHKACKGFHKALARLSQDRGVPRRGEGQDWGILKLGGLVQG
jgi:hypothetical protein